MKQTSYPTAPAPTNRLPKSTTLSQFHSILLGLALLGSATHGWAQGGTVFAWGDNRFGQSDVPPGLTNVVGIASGEWHSIALKADGSMIAWGANNAGQRNIPSDLTDVVEISSGGYHNLARKADGTLRVWGANDFGQSNVPEGLNNVVSARGGWVHSVALKADGTVVAWGRNSEGQATVPSGLNNVEAIAVGEYHNLALKTDGSVVAWGWNGTGATTVPPSLGNDVVAIAAGGLHSLALKSDGTVVAWGWNQYGQTDVPAGLSDVVAITGGAEHSLAVKADGTVVGWGANDGWAENDPNCAVIGAPCKRTYTGQVDVPEEVSSVVAIAAGVFHSLALTGDVTFAPPIRLSNPVLEQNTFNVSAQTQAGKSYVLQYKDSLDAADWTSLSSVPGNGSEQVFSDSTAGAPGRFYRLLQQ